MCDVSHYANAYSYPPISVFLSATLSSITFILAMLHSPVAQTPNKFVKLPYFSLNFSGILRDSNHGLSGRVPGSTRRWQEKQIKRGCKFLIKINKNQCVTCSAPSHVLLRLYFAAKWQLGCATSFVGIRGPSKISLHLLCRTRKRSLHVHKPYFRHV